MRRSICHSEPHFAKAGEVRNWKFIFTTANTLPKGTSLKFDLLSNGRDIDWEIPSSSPKEKNNCIFALLQDGKKLFPKEVELPERVTPQYEFILPQGISAGDSITFILGEQEEKKGSKGGIRAQLTGQRRRSFHLYIDTSGKKRYQEPEVFYMDVKGGELAHIRVLTPSFVGKNKRFDIVLRFEDEYGNLTGNCPEETLIELSYEQQRESLSWKIFVPETGFITLPNLYFNEEGIYTIRLKNTLTNEEFFSPPIKCFPEAEDQLFWGLLHGESTRFDSTENIENCLRHFRDDLSLNFFASSPFDSYEETPNETWKLISQNITEFDETDRFSTFLGFTFVGENKTEGMRHFLYSKDQKQIIRSKDTKSNSLKKVYKLLSPKEALSIPCFTMGSATTYNFEQFDPEFERVVEIYNAWGSSECSKKQGNQKAISSPKKKGVSESQEGSLLEALKQNKRFGFVAGGLDDRGVYQDLFDSDQEQYSPGLTAVIAKDFSKSSIFDALYARKCYGTTGPRIILGLYIIGKPMGSEINTSIKQGLLVNRHITGFVAGSGPLQKVEIVRCGEVIHTFTPKDYFLQFAYDDLTPLDTVTLKPKGETPFIFYYLRVTQEDGHMAWSSPIWIDHTPPQPLNRPVKKSSSKQVPLDLEEEEEDEEEIEEVDVEEDEEEGIEDLTEEDS